MRKFDPKNLVLACFFFSGFASLIYEVIWTRMLVLIFGATTMAISTVLTAFMAGLALGSLLFSRIMTQRAHPLVVYGILELIIGLYGLFIPVLLPFLTPLYKIGWEHFNQDFYLFSLVRFFLVSLVLLLPTTLMGATLPVLSQFFSRDAHRAGRCLGLLYAMNTFGAVLGTFSTGFILLPNLGVRQTTLTAAMINFLVAGLAFVTWKFVYASKSIGKDSQPQSFNLSRPESDSQSQISKTTAWVVLISFLLSGFAAMVYEVAWSRALSLVLGSTIYAFSAMLTTFLIGLAAGSFISSLWVERLKSPLRALGLLQIAIGTSAFCTMSLMGELPYFFVSLYQKLATTEEWSPFLWFALAFSVMFVPSFFLGTLFPCVVKVFQNRILTLGRLAGDVYAVNTLGAILGSFLAGFVFIPVVGIQNSVMAMVYLNLILGLTLILGDRDTPKTAFICGVLVLSVLVTLLKPSWNTRIMSSGVYLHLPFHAAVAKEKGRKGFYGSLASEGEVLFYKEGITATITVEKEPEQTAALRINGRKESGERFMRTQTLLGHLPLLLSPHPDMVLVIGWGSGTTVGSVIQHPVQRVKAVELEPAIVETTKYFESINNRPLQDPRVDVVVNDGRNYLLVTPDQFDVIISQPSLPWITGASNLFTQEFFALGASRLKENGVFGQWITNDAIQLEDLKSVVKAFQSAFAHTWILQTHIGDMLLLGFKDVPTLDPERIQTALEKPSIANDLRRVGVQNLYDLLSLYLMGGKSVESLTSEVVSNTDDNAYIELFGPLHFYAAEPSQARVITERALFSFFVKELRSGELLFLNGLADDPATMFLKLADACYKNDRGPCALMYAEQSLKNRESPHGHYIRGKILLTMLEYLESVPHGPGSSNLEAGSSGQAAQRERLMTEIITTFEKTVQMDPASIQARFELGKLYYKKGVPVSAVEQYRAILVQDPDSYEAHVNLGAIYLQQEKLEQALLEYQRALPLHPQDPEIHFKLGLIYAKKAQYGPAMQAYEKTLSMIPNHTEAHFNLALVAELLGNPGKAEVHFKRFLELAPVDTPYASYRKVAENQLKRLKMQEIPN